MSTTSEKVHVPPYTAEGIALRIRNRAKDIGIAAAVQELREALEMAEWLVGQRVTPPGPPQPPRLL